MGVWESACPWPEGYDPDWQALFQSLASTKYQIALVVSGGGSGALTRCFRRPGASANFVEGVIPYSRQAQASYLERPSEGSSASPQRARQLAATAFSRARSLSDQEAKSHAAGIALVAALPTVPPRRGTDRIHVALRTDEHAAVWTLELPKGRFDRATAETLADDMIFLALAHLTSDVEPDPNLASTARIVQSGLPLHREQDP